MDIGTPQSREIPIWLIMPKEIIEFYLKERIVGGGLNPLSEIPTPLIVRVGG